MQPNQNMSRVGQAAGPTRPVAPANPVKPVNPVTPVKPAEPAGGPTFDNGPSVVESKGGKKTGWIMAVVLLLIVAAGGVGFGVWAWMDGNTQKDALNEQIGSLKKQNSELQDQLNDSGTSADVDTADYIYVGEWGIKIKIPDNLEDVSYSVRNWDEGQYAGTSLCASGAVVDYGDGTPSFIVSNGMVCLSKNSKSADSGSGAWWETMPVGEYYVQGPQALIGDEADAEWESKSVNAIKEMLEDEANRSAI